MADAGRDYKGYGDEAYAASLAPFGKPACLPASGGYYLRRSIPESPLEDGMSCYPQFACDDWAGLPGDLRQLEGELVSFCAVTDPFGDWNEALLREAFPHHLVPFKEHFYSDLETPLDRLIEYHHRRAARKGLAQLRVEELADPVAHLQDWCALYGTLIQRHGIRGIPAFGEEVFRRQLAIPGLRAFGAWHGETVVGMVLWLERRSISYYHLGAYSSEGYTLRASYALFSEAFRQFQEEGRRWISLGSGAGLRATTDDGLTRFKKGWASGVRKVWLGGRVLMPEAYAALAARRSGLESSYFPVYRSGEFSATEEQRHG